MGRKIHTVMNNEKHQVLIKDIDKVDSVNPETLMVLPEGLDRGKSNVTEVVANNDHKENMSNKKDSDDVEHNSIIDDSVETKSIESSNTKRERRSRRRREPRFINSRAALLGEAVVMHKDKEIKMDSSNFRVRNQKPLTVVNERIAKLAEEEKELQQRQRTERYTRDNGRGLQDLALPY